MKLFKHPLFLGGFLFLLLCLCVSFVYDAKVDPPAPAEHSYILDDGGNIIGTYPQSPADSPPLGTDKDGISMLYKVLTGAKYTIIMALLVSVFRILLSVVFGFLLGSFFKRLRFGVKSMADSFTYAPGSLIIYVLLSPVIMIYSWAFSGTTQLIFTAVCLTLIAVPTQSLTIANEIQEVQKREFITSARTLGGSRFHLLRWHVAPYLAPRLLIAFGQQTVQALLLFAHLGILGLFIGGTDLKVVFTGGQPVANGSAPASHVETSSTSYEWGGLIAAAKDSMTVHPWLIFIPVIALTLTILAVVFMVEGMKSTLFEDQPFKTAKRSIKRQDKGHRIDAPLNQSPFEPVHTQEEQNGG